MKIKLIIGILIVGIILISGCRTSNYGVDINEYEYMEDNLRDCQAEVKIRLQVRDCLIDELKDFQGGIYSCTQLLNDVDDIKSCVGRVDTSFDRIIKCNKLEENWQRNRYIGR